jgi:hypothetical protein
MPISEIAAACAAVAVLASVLSAWRLLRGRVADLAELREQAG